MVDPYILVLAGFGGVVLLTAWLPMVLKELPLSLPRTDDGFVALGITTVPYSVAEMMQGYGLGVSAP